MKKLIRQAREEILASFAKCATPTCEDRVDDFLENGADGRVMYFKEIGVFAGICSKGHCNEWPIERVKKGDLKPRDLSIRVQGRYVSQEDCLHARKYAWKIPQGAAVFTSQGILEGPAEVVSCGGCGIRWPRENLKPPGLVMPKTGDKPEPPVFMTDS